MTPEAPSPYPRPTPDTAQLLSLPPASQERRLVGIALEISGDTATRDEAAALADPHSPLVIEAYLRNRERIRNNTHALDTLADLSMQSGPYAEASWQSALASAKTMKQIGYGAYRPFALEDLAAGQTDPVRLLELVEAAKQRPHYEQQEILTAIGKQQARTGDIEAAKVTRIAAKNDLDTDAADEIGLALIDANLTQERGHVIDAFMVLRSLTPKMRAWGVLKMSNHGHPPDTHVWPGLPALQEVWSLLNMRQQSELIGDVLSSGNTCLALDLARQMAPSSHTTSLERRAQRNTLTRIAHWQAAHGNVDGGLDTLDQMRATAEAQINESIAAGMDLPERSDDPPVQKRIVQHSLRHHEYTSDFNHASAQRTVLLARRSTRAALQELDRAEYYGDTPDLVYQAMARRAVAGALAGAGDIEAAVTVAASIGENDGDQLFQTEKASTYLDIARTIRRQRLAAAATPGTMGE